MSTEIVLVDDHQLFRDGVRNLLDQQLDMSVLGEAEDGRMALEMVRNLSPQVVIMDVTMPNLNGIDATRRILAEHPKVKIIALSMHGHRRFVQEMLKAGASGYLLKECAFQDLIQAIRTVLADKVFLSPDIAQIVMDDYLNPSRKKNKSGISLLTSKEREVLQLIAEGNTNEKTAQVLHMSRRTVEKHRARIMNTLQIDNLADLVKFAVREGLTKL